MHKLECPYCVHELAHLVTGRHIYPHRRDLWKKKFYQCHRCKAHVGCHENSDRPLGDLANHTTRGMRTMAHTFFDAIWVRKWERVGCSKLEARSAGYAWLAKQMNMTPSACHIGRMTEIECRRVVNICEPYTDKINANKQNA